MVLAQARGADGGAPQVTATVLGNHSAVQVMVSESVPLAMFAFFAELP